METKPTRFTGWAGKNLAVSLATRRRRSTTTHGTGDAGKKHVFRIEAPSATVKRPGAGRSPSTSFSRLFSASLWNDLHPFFARQFGHGNPVFRGCSWANKGGGWRWRRGMFFLPSHWREILWRYFLMRGN